LLVFFTYDPLFRAEQALAQLGLLPCADTQIKNISSGQRKRLTIGIELLTYPSALFLDEPTSGLDTTTALELMGQLKDLSRTGRTVVLSIHQPRAEILSMFDKILLMEAGGTVAYFGSRTALTSYIMKVRQVWVSMTQRASVAHPDLSTEQIQALLEAFLYIDTNGTGKITVDDIEEYWEKVSHSQSGVWRARDSVISQLRQEILKQTGDGASISFQQFVDFYARYSAKPDGHRYLFYGLCQANKL